MEDKYLYDNNIQYVNQVMGRQKGCIEILIMFAKTSMMKEFNRKAVKFHGYKLGVSGARFKMTTFNNHTEEQRNYQTRSPGIFDPYMITRVPPGTPVKKELTAPVLDRTTQEEVQS